MPAMPPPPPAGPPDFQIRQVRPHHKFVISNLAATVTAISILVILFLLAAFLLYRRLSGPSSSAAADPPPPPSSLRRFSYRQLRRATSSFAAARKLGQGGFGSVYRGSLPSGREIAVKLMDSGSLQTDREFHNELALAAAIPDRDRSPLVLPFGFCRDEPRSYAPAAAAERRALLVYDLMHNGSLQDALLDRRCPALLDWARRFAVALDIANGLRFLHAACDPLVIHGDIKPSNILLDSNLSAKIADFGLARFKVDEPEHGEESVVVDIDPRSKDLLVPWGEEDDTESTTTAGCEDIITTERSPEGDELAFPSLDVASTSEANGGCDRMSVSSSHKGRWKKRKEWWWRQDGGGGGGNSESGGGVKDYVMEWIKSEIKKERPKSDWISVTGAVASDDCLPESTGRSGRKKKKKKRHRKSEWWSTLDEEKQNKKKNRPAREWWREEFCEELTKKQRKKRAITAASLSSTDRGDHRQWWENDDDDNGSLPVERKKRRKKNWSRDLKGGGEVPKSGCTISSTPSMRGTVCYVAPEYGCGGPLSEKCDIYSFGVLLLVLISGRRPLQVTASPISEFERANLISWARHLARSGRLLDLVDPNLRAMDREQVLLCITVALSCIQRSPVRRPSIKEIVMMLTGESEPPHLPMEFSPSPPGGFSFKSQKNARSFGFMFLNTDGIKAQRTVASLLREKLKLTKEKCRSTLARLCA